MAQSMPRQRPEIDSYRPTKRPRTDDRDTQNDSYRPYRKRSPLGQGRRGGSSYRPGAPRRDYWRPQDHESKENSRDERQRSASPGRDLPASDSQNQAKSRHTKRERKENPSSRIHSLRRLLSRGGLPAIVHQEKERELAALLFDQQRENIKQGAKKNLERYHFIRFMERKKAVKNLSRLKKLRDNGDRSDALESKIHEAEVDLNYTQYAPLGQKYISLFARKDLKAEKGGKRLDNISKMNKRDFAIMSQTQRLELEKDSVEAAGMLELTEDMKDVRPPMWFEVEKRMKEGQKALDDLRDEQGITAMSHGNMVIGKGSQKQPDWLDDDGMIDAEDLDSDSDEGQGGVAINDEAGDEDEDMSDGDGGFFEKR